MTSIKVVKLNNIIMGELVTLSIKFNALCKFIKFNNVILNKK